MNEKALERMADSIEARLVAAGAPVHITGGKLLTETVKFRAVLEGTSRPSQVKAALASEGARVSLASSGGLVIEMPCPDGGATTVDMFLASVKPMRNTVALGITDSGTPLLVNLESSEGAHVLVEGDSSAVDDLVALMIESLRRWNEPEVLRVGHVDGQMDVLAQCVANGRETRSPVLVALADRDSKALRYVLTGGPTLSLHVILATENAEADLCVLFPCQVRGLGERTFKVNAPDWQGTFTLPPNGRGVAEVLCPIE